MDGELAWTNATDKKRRHILIRDMQRRFPSINTKRLMKHSYDTMHYCKYMNSWRCHLAASMDIWARIVTKV